MKKISYLVAFLFLIIFYRANAEIINGSTNVCAKPNGPVVFSLKDGISVDCAPIKNGWFEISISINLTKSEYDKDIQIKKGYKLFDTDHKEIGVALNDIPTSITNTYTSGGAPGNPQIYWMEIRGYIKEINIKTNSIPENLLNNIISKNRNNLTFTVLKGFISSNHFDKYGLLKKLYPKLTEYMISESAVEDPSPIDRIRLIFENNHLIAIIHTRNLKTDGAKDYDLLPLYGNRILIFKTPYGVGLQTFIKKNKESYNGVD